MASEKAAAKTTAFCVKCRAKRIMQNPTPTSFKGRGRQKRTALKGKCPKCGTSMFRITG